jgi:hypothetical protein
MLNKDSIMIQEFLDQDSKLPNLLYKFEGCSWLSYY